jgi:hypothetical protein
MAEAFAVSARSTVILSGAKRRVEGRFAGRAWFDTRSSSAAHHDGGIIATRHPEPVA